MTKRRCSTNTCPLPLRLGTLPELHAPHPGSCTCPVTDNHSTMKGPSVQARTVDSTPILAVRILKRSRFAPGDGLRAVGAA